MSSNQRPQRSPPWWLSIAVVLHGLTPVHAIPHMHSLTKRDSSGTTRWIPLIVIVVVIVILAILIKYRRGISRALSPGFSSAVQGAARYITAAELAAGGAALSPEPTPAATTTPTPTTRPRRGTRRTPSQISTRSLPVYNKEPGDEELVVFRGNEELQDEPADTTVLRAVEEGEGDTSGDVRSSTFFLPLPVTTPDSTAYNSSTQQLIPTENATATQSPDPRGEAPPYAATDSRHSRQISTSTESGGGLSSVVDHNATEPVGAGDQSTLGRRASGLRSFFSSFAPTTRVTPGTPAHSRTVTVSAPTAPSNLSPPPSSPPSQMRSHRPSHSSGSGSNLGLGAVPFRTLSRSRTRSNHTLNSAAHLTSPSLISLNSISAPLTHTTLRTQFAYPSSGPSVDQMKLISSRESLGLFGMPYGPDAVAHAAQRSRLGLDDPPPSHDFEAAEADVAAHRASPSSSSEGHGEGPADAENQAVEGGSASPDSLPAADAVAQRDGNSPSPPQPAEEQEPEPEKESSEPAPSPAPPVAQAPTEQPTHHDPPMTSEPAIPATPSGPGPSSPTTHVPATPTSPASPAPPTSFKPINTDTFRPMHSQASSVTSFETALDEDGGSDDGESESDAMSLATADEYGGSEAPTPRHSTVHLPEVTVS